MKDDTEQRIYVGECGCVRIESKHFRVTVQPEQFVAMLREIDRKQTAKPLFSNNLTISNNINSKGFVTIQNRNIRKKL